MDSKFSYSHFLKLLQSRNLDDAFDYRASFTPDYLFNFYPLQDNPIKDYNKKRLDSLENNMLWFATPEVQNDPYEFEGIYWEDDILLQAGISLEAINYAKVLLYHRIALAAFTSNMSDNLPMWAHYANNHHGYCVKYRITQKRAFRNILYTNSRRPVTKTFLSFLQGGLRGIKTGDPKLLAQANLDSAILQDKLFCKHSSWEYENEFRALYPFDGSGSGLNVPICELGLVVEEIYCGINCSDENKKELSRIASVLKVPCKECGKSRTEFTVFHE